MARIAALIILALAAGELTNVGPYLNAKH